MKMNKLTNIIRKVAEDMEVFNPTQEMRDWFITRTNSHIDRVKKFAAMIEAYDPKTFKGLVARVEDHDKSKFNEPELTPYIYVTWSYYKKDHGEKYVVEPAINDRMNEATLHHVKNNRHHPEFYDAGAEINTKQRDKNPDRMTDATKMGDLDLGEMVSDWLAVSEERDTSALDWADKTVNLRWKFTEDQKVLIYKILMIFSAK